MVLVRQMDDWSLTEQDILEMRVWVKTGKKSS